MKLAAGVDIGGSSVKAWVATLEGELLASASQPLTTLRPRPFTAEFDPEAWWRAIARALNDAIAEAAQPAGSFAGVTASSLRQGFVLIGDRAEIVTGILNSDRRGGEQLDELARRVDPTTLYELTGHWLAPELTLPKLMQVRKAEPERWLNVRKVLFVHDWVLWRLSGVFATESSLASAGQMADVRERRWATELLDDLGIGLDRLAPLVEAGEAVGEVSAESIDLPAGLSVVAGGGDTQFAAMGAGGLAEGAVTVVAGSSTPLQMAVSIVPDDPLKHPWVSTHLRRDLWAVETNAGYGGMMLDWLASMTGTNVPALVEEANAAECGGRGLIATVAAPIWSEEHWARKPPNALIGFGVVHTRGDLARAFLEGHAYAIRSNLDDLERATGSDLSRVILTGGASRNADFCQLIADVTGRTIVSPAVTDPVAAAGVALVARAFGSSADSPAPPVDTYRADGAGGAYEDGFRCFIETGEVIDARLPKEAA